MNQHHFSTQSYVDMLATPKTLEGPIRAYQLEEEV